MGQLTQEQVDLIKRRGREAGASDFRVDEILREAGALPEAPVPAYKAEAKRQAVEVATSHGYSEDSPEAEVLESVWLAGHQFAVLNPTA